MLYLSIRTQQEHMKNTSKHRALRIPTDLDEHILNTQEHGTITEKYIAVLRSGLNLPREHTLEHTENTQKRWGEQIDTLQQGMKQLHQQMKTIKEENKVIKEQSGFV